MGSNKYKIVDCPELENRKVVCLTLDVEQDYGDLLNEPAYEGLEYIPELADFFKEKGIPLTCFVQGSLFETHPEKIEVLLHLDAEIELHSYSHPGPDKMNVKFEVERGKKAYYDYFGRPPAGYRSPLGVIREQDYEILAENGFKFDSSIFPSLRPGAFNNLRKPTKPYLLNNSRIVEFPFTVFSDVLRIPISLSYIKLFGKPYIYLLKNFSLPSLIVFDFHLHDLFHLRSSDKTSSKKFPAIYHLIFRKIYQNDRSGVTILDELITILKRKGYSFQKLMDVYKVISR